MSEDIKVTLKKITKDTKKMAYKYIDDYAKEGVDTCPYTKEDIDAMLDESGTLLYGTFVDDKMVAISGVTLDMSNCTDYIASSLIREDNNLKFVRFSILPSARGKHILKASTEKLIDYVSEMDCDNLLIVCGLDDIIDLSIAKGLQMEMVENYDNNNRKIFKMALLHEAE